MKDIIKEIKKQIKLSKGENFDILVSLNYIMGLIQGQEDAKVLAKLLEKDSLKN